MFDIGFSELLLFGVIALVVLGPEKLPHAARTAGKWYSKFRRTISTLQSEIEAELDLAETRQKLQEELAKIKQTEAEMKREMAELRGSMKEFESAHNNSMQSAPSSVSDTTSISETPSIKVDKPDLDVSVNNSNNESSTSTVDNIQVLSTRPWENMWFLLSDYDKARRLPSAPFLPNYHADPLLNASASIINNYPANDIDSLNTESLNTDSLNTTHLDTAHLGSAHLGTAHQGTVPLTKPIATIDIDNKSKSLQSSGSASSDDHSEHPSANKLNDVTLHSDIEKDIQLQKLETLQAAGNEVGR
ncbi:Sec-independent protein translocase protein TatB [Psychrobacter sp.]|uniref:Sec-independent protein translocase protein TatB n=1 Tax=Psychrobacter sp. TaxID=56811 RepID=UPI00344BADE1